MAENDVKRLSEILRNPLFKGMKVPVSEDGRNADIIGLLDKYDARTGGLPASVLREAREVLAGANNDSCVVDLLKAGVRQRAGSEGASSHEAVYVTVNEQDFRVKFNHHGSVSTFFEVLSARLYKAVFGNPYSPEVKFASSTDALRDHDFELKGKYTRVGIASRLVEGFTDWGDFLVNQFKTDANGKLEKDENGRPIIERPARALAHVDEEARAEYAQLLREYDDNRVAREAEKFRIMRDHPETEKLLKNEKDGKLDFTTLPKELVGILQPLRDMDRESLHIRDRMLNKLPAEFKGTLVQALAETEAISNWDFANHDRANVGFVVRDGKLFGATCIDFGVAGHNVFSGKQADNSENVEAIDAAMRRPARVDDPFLHVPPAPADKAPLSEYMQRDLLDKDAAKFGYVGSTSGIVGSLPRSGAYAALMKERIWEERELDKKSDEVLRTAYRLSLFKRPALQHVIESLWNECAQSDDPNLRDMIKAVEARGHSTKTLTDDWNSRFTAIVERAGPDLAKWALLNRM